MTDYDIEVEIFWGADGEPSSYEVTTPSGATYVYLAAELQGTNLLDLIDAEKVTVYGQEVQYTREEHYAIYGW